MCWCIRLDGKHGFRQCGDRRGGPSGGCSLPVIVVLEAHVLYPPSLRHLLLTLAALGAFDVRWSDEILD